MGCNCNEPISFTVFEMRALIQYFKKKMILAKLQQPILSDELKRTIIILEWHLRTKFLYLRTWFLNSLIELQEECKLLQPSKVHLILK
jgi:hypothetical protein